jgi:hypothetical protein
VQGAAHHLMLMGIATLRRKKKKYRKILGIPPMEVHDALYFFVKLKNLLKALILGKELLENEPLNVVKKEFPKIKWKIPLQVEGKCGFRLGDTVEIEKMSIADILRDMTMETYLRESALRLELEAA